MNNRLRESMDMIIEYYTASIQINDIIIETDETMPKSIIQKRIEKDGLVLDILEEDYQILLEILEEDYQILFGADEQNEIIEF